MTLRLNGSTSGYVEIDAPATAGSNTLTLPNGNGSSGQYLQTNGSGTLSWQTVASPTIIEASGYIEGNGGSATDDAICGSFTGLDFSNYEGNLLQIIGRTTVNEQTNFSDAAVLYVQITDGSTTTVIAGSRNGNPYGGWDGNHQWDINTAGLYTIPSTYAKAGITLRLIVNVSGSGTFSWGDQVGVSDFDNIGDGIQGGFAFQYIVFG